jgi:hypothetical protein
MMPPLESEIPTFESLAARNRCSVDQFMNLCWNLGEAFTTAAEQGHRLVVLDRYGRERADLSEQLKKALASP